MNRTSQTSTSVGISNSPTNMKYVKDFLGIKPPKKNTRKVNNIRKQVLKLLEERKMATKKTTEPIENYNLEGEGND